MDATVLTSRRDMFNLKQTMRNHKRIIMMGHGSPSGLIMSMVGGVHGVDQDEDGDLVKYSSYSLFNLLFNLIKYLEYFRLSFFEIFLFLNLVKIYCKLKKPNILYNMIFE